MNIYFINYSRIITIILFSFFSLTSFAQFENPPYLNSKIPDQEVFLDSLYKYVISESTFLDDDESDSLSFTFNLDSIPSLLPDWLTQDVDTLFGTPRFGDKAIYKIIVNAEDLAGNVAQDTFDLLVRGPFDTPPTLEYPIPDLQITEFNPFTFSVGDSTFHDVDDNDSLIYTYAIDSVISDIPDWMNQTNGILSGTPTTEDKGVYKIAVTAEDRAGNQIKDIFKIRVTADLVNPPVLVYSIPDIHTAEDTLFIFTVSDTTFYDADEEDILTYNFSLDSSVTNLPYWLEQTSNSTIKGIPTLDDAGTYKVVVKATDLTGEFELDTFKLKVLRVNDAPIVVNPIGDQLKNTGFGTFKIGIKDVFDDEESDILTYEVNSDNQSVVTVEIENDSLVFTEEGSGDVVITFKAFDEEMKSGEHTFSVSVYPLNQIINFTVSNTGSNGLPDNNITSLYVDEAGDLWIGGLFEKGNYINGVWNHFSTDMLIDECSSIWKDEENNTYFVSRYGLLKVSGSEHTILNHLNTEGLYSETLTSYVDESNTLWMLCINADYSKTYLVRNQGEGFVTHSEVPIFDSNYYINKMLVENNGTIWLGSHKKIYNNTSGDWVDFYNNQSISMDFDPWGPCLYQDKDHTVWIANSNCLYSYKDNVLTPEKYLSISSMTEDSEGKLWVGDDMGNIYIHDNGEWKTIVLDYKIPDNYLAYNKRIISLASHPDGRMYAGSSYGMFEIDIYNTDKVINYNTYDGLPENNIWNIIQDKGGVFWIKTYQSGATRYDGSSWEYLGEFKHPQLCAENGDVWFSVGRFTNNDSIKVLSNDKWITFHEETTKVKGITSIVQNGDGKIWVGGSNGISSFDGTNWLHYTTDNGLLLNNIKMLFGTTDNNLWVEYRNYHDGTTFHSNGTSYFDGDSWYHFDADNGLLDEEISDFAEDSEGNIWVGTWNNGVAKYDGTNWIHYTMSDGLKANYIEQVAIDKQDRVWIVYDWNNGDGISRFDGEKWEHFTTENGLSTNKIRDIFISNGIISKSEKTKNDVWLSTVDLGVGTLNSDYFGSCIEDLIYVESTIFNTDSIYLQNEWQDMAGIYKDTLINSGGCDSIIFTTLTIECLEDINYCDTLISSTDSIYLEGEWQSDPRIYYDTTVNYQGCETITITTLQVQTSVDELEYNPYLIYPNPTKDVIYVELPVGWFYRVYNLNGSLLLTSDKKRIDLSRLRDNVFIISIWNGTKKVNEERILKVN